MFVFNILRYLPMYKNTADFNSSLTSTNEDKVINIHCKTTDLNINASRAYNTDNIMFITNIAKRTIKKQMYNCIQQRIDDSVS